MPEPPVWMVLTPKQGWMSCCQQSLCWNFSSIWHWWLWMWRDALFFPLHTRKAQHKPCKPQWENTSLFNMPWAPPCRAAAAFHSNCLNLTNTVAMIQCFPYAVMLMKRIDHRCGCGSLASPQTPFSALLRTWGQAIKAGDRSPLSCLLIHTGPASSLELEFPHAPVSRQDGDLSLLVTLPSPQNPKIWHFFTFSQKIHAQCRVPETFRNTKAKQVIADKWERFCYFKSRADFKHSCSCCVVYQTL